MTTGVPRRHWRSYGTEPLPSGPEAMAQPLAAFPSWFLRIECERCGKVRMLVDRGIIKTFSGETGDEITHSWCHPSRRIGPWLGGDSRVRSSLMHRVDGGFENRKVLLQ
jgi:hypothetical protein